MQLREFNGLDPVDAIEVASVWARIPAWAGAVVAGRPYASVEAVAERADLLAREWTRADLDEALAHHPRIGAKIAAGPSSSDAEAAASTREQAAMATASGEVAAAMARANAEYELRFGRVFLIRAAGRSADEMLAEVRRRMGNDDDAEVAEALDQLRQIALLRLHAELKTEALENGPFETRGD